jgi:hypothetical protein
LANGHKQQVRKRAEKRRRERRARRAQRPKRVAAPPSRDVWVDGGEITCAWATPELPFAVSGRLAVVLAVRGRGGAGELVHARGSLLAGGYLGSMAALLPGGFEDVLSSLRQEPVFVDERLEEVTADEAARMMWGMFEWSASRVTIDPDEFDGPCLGRLPAPPGRPATWLRDFRARVPGELLRVADEHSLACLDDLEAAPIDRLDPAVLVGLRFASERPLTLAAEIERNASEFGLTADPSTFDWRPPSRGGGLLPLRRPPPLGQIVLIPDGVKAIVGSAAGASALALRLQELDPALELSSASWRLVEAPPGELRLTDT